MFYTYVHFRKDDGKPFYVGKGHGNRYLRKNDRTFYWNNVVNKHGLDAKIMAVWPTEAEAFEHEKLLIQCFRDMGIELVNMTNGGEGTSGWMPSEEWRAKKAQSQRQKFSVSGNPMLTNQANAKRSKVLQGRFLSEDHKAKIAQSLIGNKNTLGKNLSEEHKAKISKSLLGNKRNVGRKNSVESNQKRSESIKAYRALQKTLKGK